MKTAIRIIGIITTIVGFICLPSLFFLSISGSDYFTSDEMFMRRIFVILFVLLLFAGGIISMKMSYRSSATLCSGIALLSAGLIQRFCVLNYQNMFRLSIKPPMFLVLSSWATLLALLFGCIITAFSIVDIMKKKSNGPLVVCAPKEEQSRESDYIKELDELSQLLKKGVISQEEFDTKKKQLLSIN